MKRVHKCPFCRTLLFLDIKFDAWWCPRCDKWAEETCGDEQCKLCEARPSAPSQVQRRKVA